MFSKQHKQAGNEAKRVSKQILVPIHIKDASLNSSGLLFFWFYPPEQFHSSGLHFSLHQLRAVTASLELLSTFAVSSYLHFKTKQRF